MNAQRVGLRAVRQGEQLPEGPLITTPIPPGPRPDSDSSDEDIERHDYIRVEYNNTNAKSIVATKNSTFFSHNLPRLALAPNAVNQQVRGAATQKLSEDDAQSLLASQRLQRPVSPHITTYDYTQIWLGASIWTRFTGMMMTGSLYAYSLAYLAAPLAGWHLESATLAASAATLPVAVKVVGKFLIAWPVLFHSFNGTRHLVWDLAIGYKKSTIKKGGWVLWAASLVSALGLTFLY